MALSLKDVVESRVYQRASSVRRDPSETRDTTQTRRERFSLDDADQRAAAPAQTTAATRARPEAYGSRADRSESTGSRTEAARADSARTHAARSNAERTVPARHDTAALDRTRPDVARPETARTDDAKSDATKSDVSKADDTETDETAADAGTSETAEADPSKPKARGQAPETARTATSGKPPVTGRPGDPTAATAGPAQADGSASGATTADGTTADASAAPGTIAGEEAKDAETIPDALAATASTMAVVAPPPSPVAPLLRGTSSANASGPEGDAEIEADGSTTRAAGSGAATASVRGSATAGPGFDAAVAEIAANGSGDDSAASMTTQGLEPAAGGTPGASQAPSEAKAAGAPQQPAAVAPAAAPVPLGAVPMTIGLRALGASSRFEIRLDPKDLGRIDVSIDIDKDKGTVGASLVVDRPETLALLQRDASSLQQALAQTGLDASAGISLTLRGDQGDGQRNGSDPQGQARGTGPNGPAGSQPESDQATIDLSPLRTLRGLGRVDIRI